MLKMILKKFFETTSKIYRFCRQTFIVKPLNFAKQHITTWPRLGLVAFALLMALYYPVGAFLTHSIDTDTSFEAIPPQQGSATIISGANLIKREINNKIWTPNLPFFFPASILDNMPAFQKGLISGISTTLTAMSKKIPITDATEFNKAAELLNYPPTIWMFSPQNKLLPVPSSNSQYRRARKFLIKYNDSLVNGEFILIRRPQDFSYILGKINNDLKKSTSQIEEQIRENSTSLIDFKADDIFYYQQGKLYSYYILLKALGSDYKEIIIKQDIYQSWTSLLKILEDASHLNPTIVRNNQLDNSFAPNHLVNISYYTNLAIINLSSTIQKLNQLQPKDTK